MLLQFLFLRQAFTFPVYKEETVGRKRLKGMPETLARNQCGGQAGFERALANGELVRIKQDGTTFYAWKEIRVDHSTGSTKRTVGNSGSMQIDDGDFQQLQQQTNSFDIAMESADALALAVQAPFAGLAAPSTPLPPAPAGSAPASWTSTAPNPLPLADAFGPGRARPPVQAVTPAGKLKLKQAEELCKKMLAEAVKFAENGAKPSTDVGKQLFNSFEDAFDSALKLQAVHRKPRF